MCTYNENIVAKGGLEVFFCCPECNTRDKLKDSFIQHGLDYHPDSREDLLRFMSGDLTENDDFQDEKLAEDIQDLDDIYMKEEVVDLQFDTHAPNNNETIESQDTTEEVNIKDEYKDSIKHDLKYLYSKNE